MNIYLKKEKKKKKKMNNFNLFAILFRFNKIVGKLQTKKLFFIYSINANENKQMRKPKNIKTLLKKL